MEIEDGKEVKIGRDSYQVKIYNKDTLPKLVLVKQDDGNSRYKDVISIADDKEGNRIMSYYSSAKNSEELEFSDVTVKRLKGNKNDFKFRYANESEVYDWQDKDTLYESHDFIQKDVKCLLQAEEIFETMNKEINKKEEYVINKEDLREIAKEQRTEKTSEITRRIKEEIKTEEKETNEKGDNEK